MRIPRPPHAWKLSPAAAARVQQRLASRVRRRGLEVEPRSVAGLDCAFSRDGRRCLAAVVVWDPIDEVVIEERFADRPLSFPYVPGLLSFREAPALLAALRKLRHVPEALMVDGHGLAHPRRFGIACHVGVLCDLPTIGVAKSRLVGEHRQPAAQRGSRAALLQGGERIGTVLRTRSCVKPVFVSIGHATDLASAERLVLRTGGGFRLPEPTRRADAAVARFKRTRGS